MPEVRPDADPSEYDQLRRIARSLLRNEAECTLTATGLVHELFLKASGRAAVSSGSESESTFSALVPYAPRVMRQILIDRARRRIARIRAQDHSKKEDVASRKYRAAVMLVELDDAIELLGNESPEHAELVRLHLYDALALEIVAERMGISRATAFRKWAFCRTWLASKLMDA